MRVITIVLFLAAKRNIRAVQKTSLYMVNNENVTCSQLLGGGVKEPALNSVIVIRQKLY